MFSVAKQSDNIFGKICTSTEELIKQHMSARMAESGVRIQAAEAKSIHFEKEVRALKRGVSHLH